MVGCCEKVEHLVGTASGSGHIGIQSFYSADVLMKDHIIMLHYIGLSVTVYAAPLCIYCEWILRPSSCLAKTRNELLDRIHISFAYIDIL